MIRPNVLIFAGSDPSGGAGLQADLQAVAALGAHPLTVVTVLTAQDNDRVFAVQPVASEMVQQQAQVLIDKMEIAAVKIGIVGNQANALVIARLIAQLKQHMPQLPVVLDTVLASGQGDALSTDHPVNVVTSLLPSATLVTPNLPEAAALCNGNQDLEQQATTLLSYCPHVLIKGGHGNGAEVVNHWFAHDAQRSWRWPRLPGEFHGTGCTLASAIAALLAGGMAMESAIGNAQEYCYRALQSAYAIAQGQYIPQRGISSAERQ